MLGQVRFPPILRLDDRDFLAPLQEELRASYPEFAQEDQLGFLVGPQGPVQTPATRRWRLATSDAAWSVVVAPEFLTLEASAPAYTDYQEFRHRFGAVWDAALRHIRPSRRVQQGLRYVNHIERAMPIAAWRELVNPTLLGSFAIEVFGEELAQGICDLRIQRADGILAMKHGLLRAGPDQSIGYLLDFDYFSQTLSNDLAADDILRTFDDFHGVIYPLFRWSVTERAVRDFRGGGADA
jgi:uncharacterized protein (TIGR04255 family)